VRVLETEAVFVLEAGARAEVAGLNLPQRFLYETYEAARQRVRRHRWTKPATRQLAAEVEQKLYRAQEQLLTAAAPVPEPVS
jgi:hypothetical protein